MKLLARKLPLLLAATLLACSRASEEQVASGPLGTELDRASLASRIELPGGLELDGAFRAEPQDDHVLLSAGAAHLRGRPVLPASGWTLQAHVRLDAAPSGQRMTLLRSPGSFRVEVERDLDVKVVVESDPPLVFAPRVRLGLGHWSYLGLSYHGEFLSQLRVVVDGMVAGTTSTTSALGRETRELVLGDPSGRPAIRLADLSVAWHCSTTDEMIQAFGDLAAAGYRPGASSSPAARTGVLAERRIERLEQWQRGTLVHALPTEDGLLWVPGQWTRHRTTPSPLARTTHPSVFLGDHQVFVFSGEVRDNHLSPMVNASDTWLFHTDSASWERVPTPLAPRGRCHQAADYSPDHGVVLMAGGYVNDREPESVLEDVWLFDVPARTWRRQADFREVSNCGVVYHPELKRFVLVRRRQVLAYDPATDEWQDLPVVLLDEAGRPEPFDWGTSPITCLDPGSGRILLFGGAIHRDEGTVYPPLTVELDVREGTATVLRLDPAPEGRVRAATAFDTRRGRLVFFGGVRGHASRRYQDLWTYDPAARAWTEQLAAGAPGRRGGYYGMAYDPVLDAFFLLCGRRSRSHFLNDAWSLKLGDDAVARATFVFEWQSWSGQAAWSIDADVPAGAQLSRRFRTGSDLVEWSSWCDDPDTLDADTRYVMVELGMQANERGEGPRVRSLGF